MVRVVIGKVVGDNGKSLEYAWNNDTYQLGLRKEGDTEYTWSPSLRGIQGEQGIKGDDGFTPVVSMSGTTITVISKDPVDGTVKTYTVNIKGDKGDLGYYFTPSIDSSCNLSWSNNGGLTNPSTVNLKGETGYYFTPNVDADCNLSWTNNGGLTNPATVNIKGTKGDKGDTMVAATIVDTLPDPSDSSLILNSLYYVPNTTASGNDKYTEYFLMEENGTRRFEQLGEKALAYLTNYYTKTEIDAMIGNVDAIIG